jgi:serine/threonine protein kinase
MSNIAFRRFSKETKEIILKMLIKNPQMRITPEEVLKHKYFVKKWNFGSIRQC